jgi:hypothetical protein
MLKQRLHLERWFVNKMFCCLLNTTFIQHEAQSTPTFGIQCNRPASETFLCRHFGRMGKQMSYIECILLDKVKTIFCFRSKSSCIEMD